MKRVISAKRCEKAMAIGLMYGGVAGVRYMFAEVEPGDEYTIEFPRSEYLDELVLKFNGKET